jgi:hypothetical protein
MDDSRQTLRSTAPFLLGVHGACLADREDGQQGFLALAREPRQQLVRLHGYAFVTALAVVANCLEAALPSMPSALWLRYVTEPQTLTQEVSPQNTWILSEAVKAV